MPPMRSRKKTAAASVDATIELEEQALQPGKAKEPGGGEAEQCCRDENAGRRDGPGWRGCQFEGLDRSAVSGIRKDDGEASEPRI